MSHAQQSEPSKGNDPNWLDYCRFIVEYIGMSVAVLALTVAIVTQYESEKHRAEEQQAQSRPILAVSTAYRTIDNPHDGSQYICEIVNVGKGVAADIKVHWALMDGRQFQVRTNPRHALPGGTVKVEYCPTEVFSAASPTNNTQYSMATSGYLLLEAFAATGTRLYSKQTFTVEFNNTGTSKTRFAFHGLVLDPEEVPK